MAEGVLFTITGGGTNPDRIAVVSLDSGEYRTVVETGTTGGMYLAVTSSMP